MKVGIGIADIMCGMYASSAILAALHHRHKTGAGQHIDLALLDTQVAWLTYEGLNYLTSGEVPERRGNEHPNIVPYKTMPASDGYFILAVGNDRQFQRFCEVAGRPDLAADPRFATNAERVRNRRDLYPILEALTPEKTQDEWVEALNAKGVPCGPVNTLDRVFADPQIQHRGMQIRMDYPEAASGRVDLIGNPINFSETPIAYRRPPPKMGEHTDAVLEEALDLSADEIAELREKGVI
jgi:crotonobetainyl-CoA:carnitine CoA-transferase CaiB-like acyl-CoA transferase